MKLNCTNPNHKDNTPSMEIYPDSGYCFVCGWVDLNAADISAKPKVAENLYGSLKYIDGLQSRLIRGLQLPYDYQGYYIVWPDRSYYKKRLFIPNGNIRYLAPRGLTPTPLAYPQSKKSAMVIEGELNCISAYHSGVFSDTLISPGSANSLLKFLTDYNKFDSITIVVDKDKPGVIEGLKLKSELLRLKKRVNLIAVETDLNEIYEKEGAEGIKKWKTSVGL